MKTDVYSWRVSPELRADLERESRLRKLPVSAILETAVRDLLKKGASDASDEQRQNELHASAAPCLGAFDGGNPNRAESAPKILRQKLRRRYGR